MLNLFFSLIFRHFCPMPFFTHIVLFLSFGCSPYLFLLFSLSRPLCFTLSAFLSFNRIFRSFFFLFGHIHWYDCFLRTVQFIFNIACLVLATSRSTQIDKSEMDFWAALRTTIISMICRNAVAFFFFLHSNVLLKRNVCLAWLGSDLT